MNLISTADTGSLAKRHVAGTFTEMVTVVYRNFSKLVAISIKICKVRLKCGTWANEWQTPTEMVSRNVEY